MREQLLPLALGKPCPGCGEVMTDPKRMHLHHSDPDARKRGEPGDVMVCATCNTRWGDRPPAGMVVQLTLTHRSDVTLSDSDKGDGFLSRSSRKTPDAAAEPVTLPRASSAAVTDGKDITESNTALRANLSQDLSRPRVRPRPKRSDSRVSPPDTQDGPLVA